MRKLSQAYKELVQIWHPDRYVHNPRLQHKAEAKFKEINLAYQNLMEHLEEPIHRIATLNHLKMNFKEISANANLSDEDWVGKFLQWENLLKLPELKDQLVLKSEIKQYPLGGIWVEG